MSLRQNAFVLLLLTALLSISGDWAESPELAHLWRLPAALLLLGLGYELYLVQRAQLRLEIRTRALWYLTRPTALLFEVSHRLARELQIEIAPQPPAGLECSRAVRSLLVGSATAELALSGVADRLGEHSWPAQRARIAGPLGLAWWPQRLPVSVVSRVMPDIGGAATAASALLRGGARAGAHAGAGAELLQLREFRPGDPLRLVDWKASARRGALISRDFAEDQHLDIVLAVDCGRSSGIRCGDLDRLGHYVNLAARFAAHAVARDDRVGLVAYGDRPLAALSPARGQGAVRRIHTLLGALTLQPTDSNPLHAAMRIRALVRHRCLVLLLTDVADAWSGSQLVQATQLLTPQHVPMVVGLRSDEREAFARATDGDWLDPYRALAAEEDRLRAARSVRALNARGVLGLVSRPELLERAVFDAYEGFRRARRV